MSWPTPSEYQEAMQFPEGYFVDPTLKRAEIETGILGLPVAMTGSFAVVFQATIGGTRKALKCFTKPVHGQLERYVALSKHLEATTGHPFAPFRYIPDGIAIDGTTYPILSMDWVEGLTLNRFVSDHVNDSAVLERLAVSWLELVERLRESRIAHGDLQHGNVIVDWDGTDDLTLHLVDYDACFVPMLKGSRSNELGHRNYQHPERSSDDFHEYLDSFSALAIYLSIRACAAQPGLWTRFDTGENMLFQAGDFHQPASSAAFSKVRKLAGLEGLAEALSQACVVEPRPLNAPLTIEQGGGAFLPDQHRRRLPGKARRRGANRVAWALVLAMLLGSLVLGAVGATAWIPALLLGGLLSLSVMLYFAFRKHELVRHRTVLEGRVSRVEGLMRAAQSEAARMEGEALDARSLQIRLETERLAELCERRVEKHLKHHFLAELEEKEIVPHRVVVRAKSAAIRTAVHVTPASVAGITEIGDESRRRLLQWRSTLDKKYREDTPSVLSPSDSRQIERHVKRLTEERETTLARLKEKSEVYRRELNTVGEELAQSERLTIRGLLADFFFGRAARKASESPPVFVRHDSQP